MKGYINFKVWYLSLTNSGLSHWSKDNLWWLLCVTCSSHHLTPFSMNTLHNNRTILNTAFLWFANRAQKHVTIILHLSACITARCCIPTLYTQSGIIKSYTQTSLFFTSMGREGMAHRRQMFITLSVWCRCRAMHTQFRWWIQSVLCHELFQEGHYLWKQYSFVLQN